MSDAHMLAGMRPGLLSPEYLHFHAARRANVPLNAGVGLNSTQEALRLDGQPLEAECPYSDSHKASWKPPSKFTTIWTRNSKVGGGKASEELTEALRVPRAPVLVLRISRSFHAPAATTHLVVEDGGNDRRLHAVMIVGMGSSGGAAAFLARNSWGVGWGHEGHAWLPLAYVDARAVEVIEVEE